MTFAELIAPLPTIETQSADRADNPSPTINTGREVYSEERRTVVKECLPIRAKAGLQPSAPSAPALVPLETPWIDGQRYRLAGATEIHTRLDLYFVDAAGPWIRRHGTILLFSACSPRQQ
jgi:hypothetical protein